MIKGKLYTWDQIESFANNKVYDIAQLSHNDTEIVGESFKVLRKDNNDITISFVLVSAGSSGFIYECIYSDL
jgi:hypothetical protein